MLLIKVHDADSTSVTWNLLWDQIGCLQLKEQSGSTTQ